MASIYIYSPSSAVRDKAAFKRGIKRLQKLGHTVELDPAALASHMRFAGDDATRVAAIARAAASGADIALISRGGYGLTRILPAINFKAVAKAIGNGTQFVGLSDFTAFQSALLARTGAVSWAGPALGEDFGCGHDPDANASTLPDDIMEACFEDLATGVGEGSGWTLPIERRASAPSTAKNSLKNSPKSIANYPIDTPVNRDFHVKDAVLWGGNLAMLVSLLGTPYFPHIDKGILFLEDVGTHPYQIERMLTQLLHTGVLARQKAVLLGQFTRYKLVPAHDKGFKMQTVVDWLRSQTKTPILTGLPFGHVPTKVCLPVGQKMQLSVAGRDALLYWG